MTRTRRSGGLLIGISLMGMVLGSACGFLGAPAVPSESAAQPSPTLLPPPKPFSSPEAGPAPQSLGSPSPVAAAKPTVPPAPPTPIPAPNLNPGASSAGSGERATVVNTDNQGANMRAEPAPTAALVRTIKEGSELELIGGEREGGGRRWRNVRDPASGASGWIVSDLLAPIAGSGAPAAAASPAAEAKPAAASSPAPASKPAGEAKPAGEPKPSASPAAAGGANIAAQPAARIGDADRAYLTVLQTQVDAIGKGITAANEQIERAGGRPDTVNDPGWQNDTRAVAKSLTDAAAQIKSATPGPATGEVDKFAKNAADRAVEAANGLTSAIDNKDARALNGVRTTLVRVLAEINNMNLTLLNLQ